MSPESIGSVSVGIGGDYSELLDAFEASRAAAEAAGQSIGESFVSAAAMAGDLDAAFGRLVSAGYSYEEALGVMSDATNQVIQLSEQAATQLGEVANAAGGATGQLQTLSEAELQAARDATMYGEAAQGIVNSQRAADEELLQAQSALDQIRAAYSLGEASANDLARAEQAVQKAYEQANPAVMAAQEAASGASEQTATLTDKLVALGEALAITGALKEFGEKAVEVAAEQEKLTISLTALGNSAAGAQAQLEEIDRFSFKNALDIDTVEAATQKLSAFKFSAKEIPELLQAAADSAAATGKSFDSTAEKISNMAFSGAAGAKQLTSLGISLDDLGAQLGVTGDKAVKAFKDLDQSERVTALTGALDKFAGTAAKIADSTSGNFQNLKNDVHNLFEEIGGSLLPAVNGMLGVLRDDVIPVLKSAVQWFEALPEPVKQLAIDAGLVTAGLVPLAAGVAAVSLALDGVSKVLPITIGLLESLGVTSASTAAQEDLAAASTLRMGEAATTASEEIGAAEAAGLTLSATLGTALVVGAAAAVISLIDLKERLAAAHDEMKGISDSEFGQWLKTVAENSGKTALSIDELERRQKSLKSALDLGGISLGQYNTALDALGKKLESAKASELADAMAGLSGKIHIVTDDTIKAHDAISVLRDTLAQAKEKLDGLGESYDTGKTTAGEYEKASKAVETAQTKLNDAVADATAKAKLSAVAYQEWTDASNKSLHAITPYLDSIQQLAGAHDVLTAKQETVYTKQQLLIRQWQEAQEKLFVLNQGVKDAAAALDGTATAVEAWQHAMVKASAAADDLKKKTDSLIAAQIAAAAEVNHISGAVEDLRTAQDVAKDSQAAWTAQTKLLQEQLYEAQQRLVQLNEFVKQAAAADDGSTAAHERWIKAVEAATKASDDLAAKQEDLAKAHGKAKDATDNLSTTAIGYGVTMTETVVPASEALQVQTEYTTKAIDEQTSAARVAVPAIEGIGTAARAAADQVGSLAKDLQQLTSDFLNLGNAKSKSLSLGSAPAGYYWQTSGNAFTGFKVNLAQLPEGMEIGPMGTPIPIPGYWEDKQAQGGYTASSQYSGDGMSSTSSDKATIDNRDTAAAGGTYPGVVIHQAPGEVLLVALASSNYGGGAAAADSGGIGSATQAASAAALAASTTSLTVSTAAGTMANVVGALQSLTDLVAETVQQTQQVASRLALIPLSTATGYTGSTAGGTVTGTPSKNTSVGAGMGNVIGQTITVGGSLYPTGGSEAYLASLGVTPPSAPAANSGTDAGAVQVTVTGNNFTGISSTDMARQVQGLVTEGITRVLRDRGARY